MHKQNMQVQKIKKMNIYWEWNTIFKSQNEQIK